MIRLLIVLKISEMKKPLSYLTKPLVVDVNHINFSPFPTVNRAQFQLQLSRLEYQRPVVLKIYVVTSGTRKPGK
jgi:hypothetical protein